MTVSSTGTRSATWCWSASPRRSATSPPRSTKPAACCAPSGRVLPATTEPVVLKAELVRATLTVEGQVAVANSRGIRRVELVPADCAATARRGRRDRARPTRSSRPRVAVHQPAPGALRARAARRAVAATPARVVQVANLRPQVPETAGPRRRRPPGGRPRPRRPGRSLALRAATACSRSTPDARPRVRASSRCRADVARADGLVHDPEQLATGPAGSAVVNRPQSSVEGSNDGSSRDQRLRAHRALVHPGAARRGADAGVELVAVNDPMGDSHTVAFLLKHDSVGGTLRQRHPAAPTTASRSTVVRSSKLEVMDPAEIPWSDHGVDVVIESTGLFTAREKAAGHLGGSVERVIISAPSGDADATICMGVNDDGLRRRAAHRHLERVLHHQLPRADGEGAQRRLRHRAGPHDDGARLHERPVARRTSPRPRAAASPTCAACASAALSIIPSSTGAAKAIGLVLPELKGKLDGTSLRVPTPTGSITDLSANLADAGHGRRDQRRVRRRPRTTSRTAACSSTPTSRWCRPTSSATRRRASSRPVDTMADGHDGQGARLVRQRVGLLQPARRPRRVRRRVASGRRSATR